MPFLKANARWLAVGFLLTLCSSFGQTFYISIWSAEIRAEFGLSHGGFGAIYMMATLGSAATLPVVGKLIDTMPVRQFAVAIMVMLAVGAFVMASTSGLIGLVLAIYLLRLFGQGLMTHTAMTAMGRWFSAGRGRAVSIATIGHQAGEAVLPILFVSLAAYLSWRQTWIVVALIVAFVALPTIAALTGREREPSDYETSHSEAGRQWTRTEVMRDGLFWVVVLGVMVPPFVGTSIFFHQDYLISTNGWSAETYYYAFALMAATTTLSALCTGVAIDRVGSIRIVPQFFVPLGLACLVLGSFDAPATAFVFMLLLGISYGMSSSLFGALWPEIYGTLHLGAIRSMIVAIMVFCTAAGPGVTGYLIDAGIGFKSQLQVIGVYCFAMALLMAWASIRIRRRTSSVPRPVPA